MCSRIEELVAALGSAVASLDVARLGPVEASRLVEVFARAERLSVAGRTLAAGRVQDTAAWKSSGFRSAAKWVASRTQSGVADAIETLQTARGLSELPATRDAFLSGRLSHVQATEITAAAVADPAAEPALLAAAEQTTVRELREQCRMVRAAASGDEDATERIRWGRYFRAFTDRDGAIRLDARLAPDDGARLLATVSANARRLQAAARRSGQRESAEAYAADALVGLADGAPGVQGGVQAVVHVRVDRTAFERGHTVAGEECRIPGVGPITVSAARRLATGGIVKLIEHDGVDVTKVTHAGRMIPAHLRTALEARDPACVAPGCDVRDRLEIDHVIPVAAGGPTRLNNLARLCRFHHAQKTHHGWRLGGRPGAWTWTRATVEMGRAPPGPAP